VRTFVSSGRALPETSRCVLKFFFVMTGFVLELIALCCTKLQGLHVGLNLAVAIALHNIPEVQKTTIWPFLLNESYHL
jgi:hypothetical protein